MRHTKLLIFIGVFAFSSTAFAQSASPSTAATITMTPVPSTDNGVASIPEKVKEDLSLLDQYRRKNPYATQLFTTPTAILLHPDDTRFGITQIMFQQINFGVSEYLQIGINSISIVILGADLKIRLGKFSDQHHFAFLTGVSVPLIEPEGVFSHTRLAYTYLSPQAQPFVLNLSGGVFIPHGYGDPGDKFWNASVGFVVPMPESKWRWLVESNFVFRQADSFYDEKDYFILAAGARYSSDTWGIQLGLTRPFLNEENDFNDLSRFIAFPMIDFSWLF